MVYVGTKIRIVDNSGVKLVRCIKVLGSNQKALGRVGDILICAVQRALPNRKIKTHDVCKCIIVRHSWKVQRKNGIVISFSKPACVVVDTRFQPIGNRIHGCVMHELRIRRHLKIISLASTLV
jgi:large subunit ribosomal protein L14